MTGMSELMARRVSPPSPEEKIPEKLTEQICVNNTLHAVQVIIRYIVSKEDPLNEEKYKIKKTLK